MRRDQFIKSVLALAAGSSFALPSLAAANIKMMIPANPGGGWDTTGRALGKALQDAGVASSVTYENKGGAAGIIGLAQYANATKGDGNSLMVMGAVMLGGIITGKPPVSLDKVTPIARLTSEYNVFVVPANLDLAGAEIELVPMMGRETRLRKAVDRVAADYEYVFIDCPPSLGLLTVNALSAAQEVLVPVQCEYFALEGLGKLLNTIKIVQSRLNNDLSIDGILLTMYDTRLRLSNQVATEVKRHFDELVYETIVHRNTKLGEAPSAGKPAILYDADSTGSINYMNLAREIVQKHDNTWVKSADKILDFEE